MPDLFEDWVNFGLGELVRGGVTHHSYVYRTNPDGTAVRPFIRWSIKPAN